MTTAIIIGIIILVLAIIIWKNKPIKNSHKLPQIVEIQEYDIPTNKPSLKKLPKGHKLILSRELGGNGYHLFVTLNTNGKDLSGLKQIVITWSEWNRAIFAFRYSTSDENVTIINDTIKINVGSFNNCNGSKNFLKRTAFSDFMKFFLLDFEPEYNNFDYEDNIEIQSAFMPILSRKELKKFRKGLHFTDS